MRNEYREFPMTELRVTEDAKPKIRGYAAVFNQRSEDLGGFVEKISPGAFTKTLKESDIRALWNHDPNHVLGRNKAGTLMLGEDPKGLAIEIDPPDTQVARDLMQSIKRGDVTQMSFGFRTIKDSWTKDGEVNLRTLEEVKLLDVSPVAFPAYPQTSVDVRKLAEFLSDGVTPPEPVETDHSDDEPVKTDHSEEEKRLMLIELENQL